MSATEAEKRIDSQMTNQERVGRSNVVLCTLWEYEYTQQQVCSMIKMIRSFSLFCLSLIGQDGIYMYWHVPQSEYTTFCYVFRVSISCDNKSSNYECVNLCEGKFQII